MVFIEETFDHPKSAYPVFLLGQPTIGESDCL